MIDLILIGNNQIEKHEKYKEQYKNNNIFWGLGIENELYLEFENRKILKEKEFLNNHLRERYSVDYFSNYKKENLKAGLESMLKKLGPNVLNLPIIMNSHSFTKSDIKNNPKTLYTKGTPDNPDFRGKTLIEFLEEKDDFFKNQDSWLFDGDTIEFINEQFYNRRLDQVIGEINKNKKIFLEKLNTQLKANNIFEEYGSLKYMSQNHPFAIYLTNFNNISMFNNGTLHYNITLPTELNEKCEITNKKKFIHQHKKLIKIIQWFEPLLICVYCSPDPFSLIPNYSKSKNFSRASQRNAISRYIGVGVYDTNKMPSGKILTKPIELLSVGKLDFWWYKLYHKSSAYNSLDQVGLDINFNKHWNHGIEIRFFDHISNDLLVYESFEFIIYLCDFILESKFDLINPILDEAWNKLVCNIMTNGILYKLEPEEIFMYENIFEIKLKKTNAVDIYYEIFYYLKNKYNKVYKSIGQNKKEYVVIPQGKFSSLTLSQKNFENKPDFYLEEKLRTNENKSTENKSAKPENKIPKFVNNGYDLISTSIEDNDEDIVKLDKIYFGNEPNINLNKKNCCTIM